jgi:hypothetical protein
LAVAEAADGAVEAGVAVEGQAGAAEVTVVEAASAVLAVAVILEAEAQAIVGESDE